MNIAFMQHSIHTVACKVRYLLNFILYKYRLNGLLYFSFMYSIIFTAIYL